MSAHEPEIKTSEAETKMRTVNTGYIPRRGGVETASFLRNRNTVRHTPRNLGTLSLSAIVGMLVLIVGLIYVTQGVKSTGYDYELSSIETEIDELAAKKEDLAVEKARLTAIAQAENSKVAVSMGEAKVAGYVGE